MCHHGYGGWDLRRAYAIRVLDRINVNPRQCGGRPDIRGMRICGTEVLELLAAGLTREQAHSLAAVPWHKGNSVERQVSSIADEQRSPTEVLI